MEVDLETDMGRQGRHRPYAETGTAYRSPSRSLMPASAESASACSIRTSSRRTCELVCTRARWRLARSISQFTGSQLLTPLVVVLLATSCSTGLPHCITPDVLPCQSAVFCVRGTPQMSIARAPDDAGVIFRARTSAVICARQRPLALWPLPFPCPAISLPSLALALPARYELSANECQTDLRLLLLPHSSSSPDAAAFDNGEMWMCRADMQPPGDMMRE